MSAAGISQSSRAQLAQIVQGRRFITPSDVVEVIGVDDKTAARKLANWASAGWMRRVQRGLYLPVPVDAAHPDLWTDDALVLADTVWAPCYFTGWTSANHWGLSEQMFRTTVVRSAARVRRGSAHLLGFEYLLGHVSSEDTSWGLKTMWHQEVRLHVADPARTVVDILDRPKIGGGIRHAADILQSYLENQDPMQLVAYGDKLGNRTVFKRLGYLVEALELDAPLLVDACLERRSAGVPALYPDGPDGGTRDTRWQLRLNVRVAPEVPS
jgi:predicted transcriptional regulator of viral defense system